MADPKPIIGYFRVSTQKQGRSGLGLEAQQQAFYDYAKQTSGRILSEYVEVESGKLSDRPELANAIAHATRSRAQLFVAKLDRLARNVAFTSMLMETSVDFVCGDNPNANRLTIHILAAVAEDEAIRISKRTKEALAALKARGVKLGASRRASRNLNAEARKRGAIAAGKKSSQQAAKAYADLIPQLIEWREEGMSQHTIANKLNELGHTTRKQKAWNQVQVGRVLNRYAQLEHA